MNDSGRKTTSEEASLPVSRSQVSSNRHVLLVRLRCWLGKRRMGMVVTKYMKCCGYVVALSFRFPLHGCVDARCSCQVKVQVDALIGVTCVGVRRSAFRV